MKRNLFAFFLLSALFYSLPAQLILTPDVDSIPLRDGKKLAVDIHLPSASGNFPVILIQTPYNRQLYRFGLPLGVGTDIAGSDYAYVIVDWRGFYGSLGAFVPGSNLGEDGYDVVEWVNSQTWCNGKIGTWGPSALGGVQYQTARENPPALDCICPLVRGTQTQYLTYYPGGCLRKEYVDQLDGLGFGVGPVVLANQTYNIIWQFTENESMYPTQIRVPTFMIGGWYDHNTSLMTELFDSLRTYSPAANEVKMLMGPWTHGGYGTAQVGDPVQGELPYYNAAKWNDSLALRFFDYYLRGITNNWPQEPVLRYYQAGDQAWATHTVWPPTGGTTLDLYLNPGFMMDVNAPTGATNVEQITFDPRDPSPTVGGPVLKVGLLQGPYNIRDTVENRNDILKWDYPVTGNAVRVQGKPWVKLFVASDRPDTDFAIRLTDVYPDGKSYLIADGIRRMRFRDSYSNPDTIVPGQVYEIEVELPDIAYTWIPGHKIRVDITSSNYPRFDVNLNNGDAMYVAGDTLIATNEVHFSATTASYLHLPIGPALTAVETLRPEIPVTIFPNPGTGKFEVRIGVQGDANWSGELMNANGVVMKTVRLLGNGAANTIDAGHLPAGIYFLRLHAADGNSVTRRIAIQR